ncbi:TetR/AcrR family transcriptional regulator [Peribacillus cavernae]|uniref:TetR/AcrR family transcriptional regulator n=1 Tax=Peribacillus cavernae TaxID=1674310 RepID=A0A433HS77_9BACI|nr:TetR/AcrR family transcriptional regulator [Peribacillus cavernae]RUQ31155.1 TetR/AcrR family transcriptional regulator [Peribacillus cavernae]
MSYTKSHKTKVRGKILKSASQAFRTNGIKEVSVPQIMKGAGLTHGGFYAHFESKDKLVAEACQYAIEETTAFLQKAADQAPANQQIQTVIDNYLSKHHRNMPEEGCIIPTLSSEISRSSQEVRQVFTEEIDGFFDFVSTLVREDKIKSIAIVSTMVGSLLLARSVDDPGLSDAILDAGKEYAKEIVSK